MFKFKSDISETKNAIDAYVDKLDFEKELKNMNILPLCDIQSKKIYKREIKRQNLLITMSDKANNLQVGVI